MGNNCSCLNDITSLCSEDLSRQGNNEGINNYINNNPKVNLSNYAISEKYDPMIKHKNTFNDRNSANSNQISPKNINNNNKKKRLDNNNHKNNNISLARKKSNNSHNGQYINNKNNINNVNNNKKENENTTSDQNMNLQKSTEISNDINNDPLQKLYIKLHKYFLKIITKKHFLKNLNKYKQEGDNLFNLCLQKIYTSNEKLSKAEQSCKIKYNKNGYKDFYPNITQEDEQKMKYIPKESKTIDNSIIINYLNNYTDYSYNNDINTNTNTNTNININNINWIYKGQVDIHNIPNGYGVKYTKNGIKQEGYWKEGQLVGWSQSIDNQGNILIGPFVEGKLTGKGIKYCFVNNTLYKGDIIENKKEGKGEEFSSEGKFVGNFANDKKNGEGKMEYSLSGDTYEGNYKDDLFDGKGHYIWKISGQEYTGEYKNGLMHGKGLYEWSEGEYYRGDFVNGKKEGSGEMHWANGRSFIGPFVNGRPQGIGIFDNGMNYKGEMEFIDGKLNREYLNKKYRGSESNSLASSLEVIDSYL